MKKSSSGVQKLRELARLYAVQTSYVDVFGKRQQASEETLRGVLAARGARLEHGIDEALRSRRAEAEARVIPPTVVAWRGVSGVCSFPVKIGASADVRCVAQLEDGSERPLDVRRRGESLRVVIPRDVAAGYHFVELSAGASVHRARLLVAPMTGFSRPDAREWGLFAPVYALANRTGVGTFRELGCAMSWASSLGASFFGTLPILATFYAERFEVSPYAPVSRLFWNELFVDEDDLRSIVRFDFAAEEQDAGEWIDYEAAYARKKALLGAAFERFFAEPHPLHAEYFRFVEQSPAVHKYAAFRAGVSGNREDERFHPFAQWLCERQLAALSSNDCGLYLDYPLGTNPFGFDVAEWPRLFTSGASAGAPPDIAYRSGQSWGFPPLDPDAIAEDPSYFAEAVRTHMRHAKLLRIDHVMSLHRLYWIPNGLPPHAGAYVRYPSEILYAILLIESHRNRCVVIGEDLGTVPPYVRKDIDRHGFRRLFVLQRQLIHVREGLPGEITPSMLASVNNHDMPPFAAWWRGADIDERQALHVYDDAKATSERARRDEVRSDWLSFLRKSRLLQNDRSGAADVLYASHEFLSRSDAPFVIASLEDLWLEEVSQNVPTTTDAQRPNWRHKFRLPLDQIVESAELPRVIASLSQHRRRY